MLEYALNSIVASAADWLVGRLNVALAVIRVVTITRVIGLECIYPSEAAKQRGSRASKKGDKRKSRRGIAPGDIPAVLLPVVALLLGDDNDGAEVLAELATASATDGTGVGAKLYALATTPSHRTGINDLAREAAAKLTGPAVERRDEQPALPLAADPVPVAVPPIAHVPDANAAEPQATSGNISGSQGDAEAPVAAPTERRTVPEVLSAADRHLAEQIYDFVRQPRCRWALKPCGTRFVLKPLDRRKDLNAVFDRIGHLPEVQAELEQIFRSPRS